MRIIHTSDWHLGQNFYGKSRANEHQQFLSWLIEQVNSHHVDAIIVAGDIFDTGNPPSYARELYFNFISSLHQLEHACKLVVLAGNHDSTAMIGESKQLLNTLSTFVIPTASKDIEQQVFVLNGNSTQSNENKAVICAVPFIRPRDVIISQAGQSAKEKQEQLQQAITDHYQSLYEKAQGLAEGKYPIIATGHLTTVGASTSDSVREIYIGTLEAFPASNFPKADYIALGHIHQMQNVGKSSHIRYCGSPIPLSFDEAKQKKHILMVDVADSIEPVITPIVVPRFQPIAMVKSEVDKVLGDIEQLLTDLAIHDAGNCPDIETITLWLDIEIEATEYHSDIQEKVTEQLKPYLDSKKIEILLIRKSKQVRQKLLDNEDKITLEELSTLDVFNERLKQIEWAESDPDVIEKKNRLTTLFQQTLHELEAVNDEVPQRLNELSLNTISLDENTSNISSSKTSNKVSHDENS